MCSSDLNVDVLTITANGEPTLYPYLKELISQIKKIKETKGIKTLILTNGSLLFKDSVAQSLMEFDMVKFSIDSIEQNSFKKIDRPHKSLKLDKIKQGIENFSKVYKGELIAEILLVKNVNDNREHLSSLADFLRKIEVDRVDIGTIDRPPAYTVYGVEEEFLQSISELFWGLNISLPKRKTRDVESKKRLNREEIARLISLRPLSHDDAESMFDRASLEVLESMVNDFDVEIVTIGDREFFKLRK